MPSIQRRVERIHINNKAQQVQPIIVNMMLSSLSPSSAAATHQHHHQQHQPALSLPLRHAIGATVTPGDRLGLVAAKKITLVPGSGTYTRQGHLYASLLGTVCATSTAAAAAVAIAAHDQEVCSQERWIISIQPHHHSTTTNASNLCPKVNMIILGRISRVILPTHAMVDIVAIVPENTKNNADDDQHNNALTSSSLPAPFIIPLTEPFSGILRQQDLRPKSSLEIRIDECYHPGDVILARIHANGAERDFILTTAESELGVIQAICERSGMPMNPISWKEMQCPVSLVKEGRKVAKPRRS